MPDTSFLYFSFIAGLAAFFAPCSFAILPGYITYYISKQRSSTNPLIGGTSSAQKPPVNWWNPERQKPRNVIANENMPPVSDGWFLTYSNEDKKRRLIKNIIRGFVFGLIASIGFFTVFGFAGFGVIAIGQFIKQFIPWIAVTTGIILIIVGILMFFGKEFLFFQAPKIRYIQKNEKAGIYLFGIVYAIGSLGCVFPIFLSIVIQGIAYKSILDGVYTIFAYVLGMSLVMIAITTLTFATKYLILKKLEKILPYVKKVSALILIFAGAYMIYYQYWVVL